MEFEVEQAFSCPDHGTSPTYIVSDGKALGPLKSKVAHLKELDVPECDTTVLDQSTTFAERTFLSIKKERDLVCKMLTMQISMAEFTSSQIIVSENGRLLQNLVRFIDTKFNSKLNGPFKSFIGYVSKHSSARSLLQVNDQHTITILQDFCLELRDLRDARNKDYLSKVMRGFPALWPDLDKITQLNDTKYLPREVSLIVLELIDIRARTFSKGKRSNTSYFKYDEHGLNEHPSQCYPLLPIWRYPCRYKVQQHVDSDLCEKTFMNHSEFCAGIYTIGCGCEKNITFGFELMLATESPRNLFRFLMCRDVDMNSLKGIILGMAVI